MVVFTCSYCGESLKKNQVEKHYGFKSCRNRSPALTCVDCLKDFLGQEYVAHTSCITEQEKYSAKGFVSKPPSQKGMKKQELWVNSISSILNSEMKLDKDVRLLLQNIVELRSVPQKKVKFMNFCRNNFRRLFNNHVFELVWQLLETIKEEDKNCIDKDVKNDDSQDRKRKRVDSSNGGPVDESPNSSIHPGNTTVSSKMQNKNKQNSVYEADSEESMEKDSGKRKKSKKAKCLIENGDPNVIYTDHHDIECDNGVDSCKRKSIETVEGTTTIDEQSLKFVKLSKKEKKQKQKQEKYAKQLMEIQNEQPEKITIHENMNDVEETIKMKKKKKKVNINGDCGSEAKESNIDSKHKKHQGSLCEVKESEEKNLDCNEEENSNPFKFNWEDTIIKVLEAKGELPLKRLEKKVVNEYINSSQRVKSVEEVIAKFSKKVMKIPRVKVRKEMVKLVS